MAPFVGLGITQRLQTLFLQVLKAAGFPVAMGFRFGADPFLGARPTQAGWKPALQWRPRFPKASIFPRIRCVDPDPRFHQGLHLIDTPKCPMLPKSVHDVGTLRLSEN